MPYDSLVLNACISELSGELTGAKVNKIHQPDDRTIIIRYYGTMGGGRLLLSAHPENGRINKCAEGRDNPAKAPLFAMVLRKWLEGARISGIESLKDERVAWLDFDARNELGDDIQLRLIIEIMGKHSNIILIDSATNIILDGIRRYGSHLSRYREVLPGKPYLPPPTMDKLPLVPANEDILAAALYELPEETLSIALRKQIKGLSPLLADNLALLAGLDPAMPVETVGEYEIGLIYRQLQLLDQRISNNDYDPIITLSGKQFRDYYAFDPPSWSQLHKQHFSSMNDAIDAFYQACEKQQSFERKKASLAKALRQNRSRLQKKIALEEADLATCEAANIYREAGDILSANLYFLRKGLSEVELPSFTEEGKTVHIKLDPAKTPQENIKYYYKRYSKAKNARHRIDEQLQSNKSQLDYLFSIEQSLEDSTDKDELAAIEKEAIAAGFYHQQLPANKKQQPTKQITLAPRQYCSQDGFTILIGRNNKQNDRLSLKQSHPDDIWLHAQKIPGSHTVIISNGKAVPQSTILEAAGYAAWFSKARGSGKTAVDYTQIANLRKPNGAVPGYVTYTDQKTVYVEPLQPPEE